MRRREFIAFLGGGAIAWPHAAAAQVAPANQNIRLVVGFSAGGATDIAARVLCRQLSQKLGQQSSWRTALAPAVRWQPKRSRCRRRTAPTLLMTPFANAANETLFKDFRYKYDDYFTAVAPIARTNNVLVVHPSLNVNSIADLIALAKSRPPGEILAAIPGVGTATTLPTSSLIMTAGIKLTSVQYRGGGEVMKDLVPVRLRSMFAPIPTVLPFLQNGALRASRRRGSTRPLFCLICRPSSSRDARVSRCCCGSACWLRK